MSKGKTNQLVLTLVCAVCIIGALLSGSSVLAREGALAVAAAFWLMRAEIRRAGRYQSDFTQVAVLLTLGAVLWIIGDVPPIGSIWDVNSAKLAVLGMLAKSIGLIMIPSCLCFYVLTPSRRINSANVAVSAKRQGTINEHNDYKIAI